MKFKEFLSQEGPHFNVLYYFQAGNMDSDSEGPGTFTTSENTEIEEINNKDKPEETR